MIKYNMSIKHPMLDVFRTLMEDNSIESVEWIPIEPDSFQSGLHYKG